MNDASQERSILKKTECFTKPRMLTFLGMSTFTSGYQQNQKHLLQLNLGEPTRFRNTLVLNISTLKKAKETFIMHHICQHVRHTNIHSIFYGFFFSKKKKKSATSHQIFIGEKKKGVIFMKLLHIFSAASSKYCFVVSLHCSTVCRNMLSVIAMSKLLLS